MVDQVLEAFPKDANFVYKQYPLESIHPHARNAARAALAAGKQGKFWEMHDELFKIYRNLSLDNIKEAAKKIGLDMARFEKDLASPDIQKEIDQDLALGRSSDVTGTPTFYVNGKRVMNRSVDGFKAMVEEALKEKKG